MTPNTTGPFTVLNPSLQGWVPVVHSIPRPEGAVTFQQPGTEDSGI